MHIEYLVTKNPAQTTNPELQDSAEGRPTFASGKVENTLLNLDGTLHDDQATELFSAASMWAYSDLKTFASMMSMRGLYGEFVALHVKNEVTFVDTTAYLFLTESKKVAILAFRGMEPRRPGGGMVHTLMKLVPHQEGLVHGGMLTANLVVLPVIGCLLLSWSTEGLDLAEGLQSMNMQGFFAHEVMPAIQDMEEFESSGAGQAREPSAKKSTKKKSAKKSTRTRARPQSETTEDERSSALYVCGHGYGGALAGLAGALLYVEPEFMPLRENLRSIYTFGAPKFADRAFADKLQTQLGERVFRHRYGRDPLPLLPTRMRGSGRWPKRSYYQHFGCEYVNAAAGGWTRLEFAYPLGMMSVVDVIGAAALRMEKMKPLWWFPPAWADHLPLNYLRTSQMGAASGEMLGDEFFADFAFADKSGASQGDR